MSSLKWVPLRRNYSIEREKYKLESSSTASHPLQPKKQRQTVVVTEIKIKSSGNVKQLVNIQDPLSNRLYDPLTNSLDPLSDPLSSKKDFNDPLSDPLSNISLTVNMSSNDDSVQNTTSNNKITWNVKKQQILKDYAMIGNISLSSSAINDFSGSGVEDGSSTKRVDKYTERLASLEKKDDLVTLTQKEYEDHINKLHSDLVKAWGNDERVGSLKIAIQLAKLLSDTNVPKFYPCMFVMVTDILVKFSDMVYNRLKNKAEEVLNENNSSKKRITLPFDFTSSDVPLSAKETTRNWFYKIACIRELLPRIYIEITLLKCYKFLTDTDLPSIMSRLASIIRGIGDPIVASYLRCYLIIIGSNVSNDSMQHVLSMVHDCMLQYHMFTDVHHLKELSRLSINQRDYLHVLSPAIDWIMRIVSLNSDKELFQSTLFQYREHCNDAIMLKHIINNFDPNFYINSCLGMVTLIKSIQPSNNSTSETELNNSICEVISVFGRKLLTAIPPEDQKIPLLNEIWKIVSKVDDLNIYLSSCVAWLEVTNRHYSERETLILLSDLSNRLSTFQKSSTSLVVNDENIRYIENAINLFMSSSIGITILSTDYLLRIIDILPDYKKTNLCKDILENYNKSNRFTILNNPIVIHTLIDICRILHDSLDHLSNPTDSSHISRLIVRNFIGKVNYDKDLESQLAVYVECRSIFHNLPLVISKLVSCVANLTIKAFTYVRGKHTKKTIGFVKACLAYSHITIPSIPDTMIKLELLLYCSQVALMNNCLPQVDTFLKAAISLIPEVTSNCEDQLVGYIRYLLSFFVVVPGHPEHGPFYLVRGLMNALSKYNFTSMANKIKLYNELIGLLSTFSQRKFPYSIPNIESNDTLYGGSKEYLLDLSELLNETIDVILNNLTSLTNKIVQCITIIEFIGAITSRFECNHGVVDFINKLIDLILKNKNTLTKKDSALLISTLEYLRRNAIDDSNVDLILNNVKLQL